MAGDKSSFWYKSRNTNPADWSGGGQPLDPGRASPAPTGALPLRPPPQRGCRSPKRLTASPGCSAPPSLGGLATFADSDSANVERNPESSSTYVKKGSGKTRTRTLFSEPEPEPEAFRIALCQAVAPLMGHRDKLLPQLVGTIAGSAGNPGASPPDPHLHQGSGFGVRHPPAWGS